MPNQVTTTMRRCKHADVGDCELTCWDQGVFIVRCWNCNNEFDLNQGGQYESASPNPRTTCVDCPTPEESATLPRLTPSLAAVISLEEG